MNHLLVATDLSDRSERAQRRATLLARRHGLAIRLVYVIDTDQPAALIESQRDQVSTILQRLARTIETSDGISCSTDVRTAGSIEVGIQSSLSDDTRLIVLGSHRKRPFRDLFLGGTSERIIAHAERPVLVVQGPPIEDYRRVLLTTDLSAGSREAADQLASQSLIADASVTVLHVAGSLERSATASNQATDAGQEKMLAHAQAVAADALDRLVTESNLGMVAQRVEADPRPVAATILEVAEREGSDLIVLAPRQRTGVETFLRYSVTTRMLNASPVDLLVL
ncbi:universal stress protein [Spiribacter vilamensis]|uniref:Nucleotide-binding universal stress UspA family protein n=1 Tax=Spiribacter vilamensis TaxID=531306 RepID=A0A4Q8D1J2_9GAMM|nr:universal stress protein [Spiribacter vilamensis]RZU99236.1 nucleotide-binding universal stress UspA family protein [Spiribacter vilamensis]TVO61777.1 universal stress protein [Spiribacter vilamensis]